MLLVEDNVADAELVIHELRQGGFEPNWERVDSEEDYLAQIDSSLDIILADYHLPQWDALDAMRLMRGQNLDIPFIVVTGTLGDELAAECMRRGAADFVQKDRMARLPSAVQNALDQRRLLEEKILAETALKESEELYRAVVENANDSIVISVGGQRVFANEAFLKLVGAEMSEVCGHPITRYIAPEDREAAEQRILARQRGRLAEVVEYQLLTRDGQRRTIQNSSVGIHFKGEPATLAFLRDVTDYKRAGAELQALFAMARILGQPRTYQRKLDDVMRQLLEAADADWVTLRLPDEQESGFRLVSQVGKDVAALPIVLQRAGGLVETAFQSGQPAVSNDYSSHPVAEQTSIAAGARSVLGLPIKAPGGTIGVAMVVSEELDHFHPERTQLLTAISDGLGVLMENARLYSEVTLRQELEERRDTFVSVASHELRTPMAVIAGYSELLLNKDLPETAKRESLERIHRNSQTLVAIVDDMLNISRIHSGKLSLNLEQVAVPELVVEVVASFTPIYPQHDLRIEIDEPVPMVLADSDKLNQILTNVVDNALKYSPGGGRVTISAEYESKEGRLVIAVADQGLGIALEDQEQLFEVFHRIRRPETADIRGSGLGLYIVKEMLDLMDGNIWLKSEQGKGSTFFISIPTETHQAVPEV